MYELGRQPPFREVLYAGQAPGRIPAIKRPSQLGWEGLRSSIVAIP